jgi:outer membrane biosynthesis protein TonB
MSRTAAAPRYKRRIGLAAVVLGLAALGLADLAAAGQASPGDPSDRATGLTFAATGQAPAPDPKPAPKPDPKPSQPKPPARVTPPPSPPPPPPPPPPPAARPTAQRSTTAPVKTRAAERPTVRTKVAASRQTARLNEQKAAARRKAAAAAAAAAALRERQRARAEAARRAARKAARSKKAREAAARERARVKAAEATLELEPLAIPTRSAPPRGPKLSLAAPVFLPLVGLGLLLVLGASVLSVRRIPWPPVTQPLYARRSDVAVVGFGAIALGLLLLNATVFL